MLQLIRKETQTQIFSFKFWEVFQESFFAEYLLATVSAYYWATLINSEHIQNNIHSIKNVRVQCFSGPCFPVFGKNTEIYFLNIRIQSGCGKIRTRKTPKTDILYEVIQHTKLLSIHAI